MGKCNDRRLSDCDLRMIKIMFKENALLTTAYSKSELQHFDGPAILEATFKKTPDLPKYVCNLDLSTKEVLQLFIIETY